MSTVVKSSMWQDVYINIKSLLIDGLLVVCSRFLLDWLYVAYIVPTFSYASRFNYVYDTLHLFVSWAILLFLMPIALIYRRDNSNSTSEIFVACLFFLAFVPGTVIVAYQDVSYAFVACFTVYWILVFYAARFLPAIHLKGPASRYQLITIKLMAIVFVVGVIYVSWRYTGFRIHLSLDNVYDLRSEAKAYNLPLLISYVFNAATTIIPVVAIYCLYKRKYPLFALLCITQILAFSVNGLKSTLLGLIIGVIAFFFFKRMNISAFIRVIASVIIIGVFAWYLGNDYIANVFIRRTLYVPAVLNVHYYDFFSTHPVDLFRQSVFSKIGIPSDYSQGFGYVIGQQVLHSSVNANNGLFSDAYANLGFAGCIVMPFLLITLLRVMEACADGLPAPILISVIVINVFTLISSLFFTALLTHGIVFICLCLYFLPRDYEGGSYTNSLYSVEVP